MKAEKSKLMVIKFTNMRVYSSPINYGNVFKFLTVYCDRDGLYIFDVGSASSQEQPWAHT